MVFELKLRKVGNSVGFILPKEALTRLNIQEGDSIIMTESTEGDYRLTTHQPDFERTMKVMQSLTRRYRNALRELAK